MQRYANNLKGAFNVRNRHHQSRDQHGFAGHPAFLHCQSLPSSPLVRLSGLFCHVSEASADDLCRDAAESPAAAETVVIIVCQFDDSYFLGDWQSGEVVDGLESRQFY